MLMKGATFVHWNHRKCSCVSFLCSFVYKFSSWLFWSCVSSIIKHLVSINFICTYKPVCVHIHTYIVRLCVQVYIYVSVYSFFISYCFKTSTQQRRGRQYFPPLLAWHNFPWATERRVRLRSSLCRIPLQFMISSLCFNWLVLSERLSESYKE